MTGWALVAWSFWVALASVVGLATIVVGGMLLLVAVIGTVVGAIQVWEWLTA